MSKWFQEYMQGSCSQSTVAGWIGFALVLCGVTLYGGEGQSHRSQVQRTVPESVTTAPRVFLNAPELERYSEQLVSFEQNNSNAK